MKSLLIVIVLLSATPETSEASEPHLREAVAKGVSFISKEGPPIGRKLGCIQCHHGPFTVWSQRVAADMKFAVDDGAVKDFEANLLRRFLPKAEQGPDKKHWRHTLASFLVLAQPTGWNPAEEPDKAKTLAYALTAGQQEDGSWKPANQFGGQIRPTGEADVLQTMWNSIALDRLQDYDKTLATPRDKALRWLQTAPANESMDARAVRVLLEHRFGKKPRFVQLLTQLINDQNEGRNHPCWLPNRIS